MGWKLLCFFSSFYFIKGLENLHIMHGVRKLVFRGFWPVQSDVQSEKMARYPKFWIQVAVILKGVKMTTLCESIGYI